MPSILLEAGVFRVTVRYVIAVRKGSSLYYHRRIPDALQSHYEGKKFRRVSLGTRDIAVAAPKAAKLAAEDDALWASLRSEEGQRARLTTPQVREAASALLDSLGLSPGDLTKQSTWMNGPDAAEVMDDYLAKRHGTPYEDIRHDERMPKEAHEAFWSPAEHEAFRILREDPTKPRRLLSDALTVYLKEHDKGVLPKFAGDTKRAVGHVFSIVGDFPLETYRRDHAVAVRDGLLKGGNKTATARRRLNTIKAVFNKGLIEFNMGAHRNPFEKLTIAKEAQGAKGRESFTSDELKVIAEACRIKDDDVRYIVALQADTGARLGEIVGLRAEDVVLDHETPHIRIRPHVALGRTLKTVHSERDVPLGPVVA